MNIKDRDRELSKILLKLRGEGNRHNRYNLWLMADSLVNEYKDLKLEDVLEVSANRKALLVPEMGGWVVVNETGGVESDYYINKADAIAERNRQELRD